MLSTVRFRHVSVKKLLKVRSASAFCAAMLQSISREWKWIDKCVLNDKSILSIHALAHLSPSRRTSAPDCMSLISLSKAVTWYDGCAADSLNTIVNDSIVHVSARSVCSCIPNLKLVYSLCALRLRRLSGASRESYVRSNFFLTFGYFGADFAGSFSAVSTSIVASKYSFE